MRRMISRSGPPRFPIPNARIFITILNCRVPWFIPENRRILLYNKPMLMISVEPGDELLRMQIGMKLAGSGTFMTEIHKEEFHFLSLIRIQLPPGTIRCSC